MSSATSTIELCWEEDRSAGSVAILKNHGALVHPWLHPVVMGVDVMGFPSRSNDVA